MNPTLGSRTESAPVMDAAAFKDSLNELLRYCNALDAMQEGMYYDGQFCNTEMLHRSLLLFACWLYGQASRYSEVGLKYIQRLSASDITEDEVPGFIREASECFEKIMQPVPQMLDMIIQLDNIACFQQKIFTPEECRAFLFINLLEVTGYALCEMAGMYAGDMGEALEDYIYSLYEYAHENLMLGDKDFSMPVPELLN